MAYSVSDVLKLKLKLEIKPFINLRFNTVDSEALADLTPF